MIRNLLDFTIGLLLNKGFISQHKIGQLGVITSLISCYQYW
jgi:hypothetical protein